MHRSAWILFVGLLLGCAVTPAKTYDFNPVANIDSDYEKVWAAVIEYFVVSELPIEMIQKDSGLIVTEWMNAGDETGQMENRTICDCGPSYAHTVLPWTRGRFSVFVRRLDDGSCDLRVTCTYQQYRASDQGGRGEVVGCNSTGGLEKAVQDYVLAKVRGSALPQVQVFKPGKAD